MPTIRRDNWHVTYERSEASGVRLGPCDYRGTRAITAASVPFVYVNYAGDSSGPFTDELRSATTPLPVDVRTTMFGFDVKAVYDIYGEDYHYEHLWRFFRDGQFGSAITIHGPGEEPNGQHIYHLPFRLDLGIAGATGDTFQVRADGPPAIWVDVAEEGRFPAAPAASSDYPWRILDEATGRAAEIRARRHEDAEVWALRSSAAERWGSFGGTLAAAPGLPGSVPAVYANSQSIRRADVVLWYLAHVDAYDLPMACGPWIRFTGF